MKVRLRDEIDNQYKWKLEDIYLNEQLLEQDFKKVEELLKEANTFNGKLLNNKQAILDSYKYQEQISFYVEKMYVYAKMKLDQDVTCEKYKILASKIEALMDKCSSATAYISSQIAENSEQFLIELSEDVDLKEYTYSLKLKAKNKKHTLSEKEEVLLSKVSAFSRLFKEAFYMLDNADIKFDSFINDKKEKVELSHGIYSLYLQTGSKRERKKAFESMFNAYKNNINLIATLYKGNVEKNVFYSKIRGFEGALDRAVVSEDVKKEVYYKLINNIHKNLKYLHKYMLYRKKQLGYKTLHMYDLHIPTVKDVDKEILYDQAKEIVLDALKPLGKEYMELLNKAFNDGWIDVYENKNKRSGAYSWGCFGTHPYVLLNYKPVLNDVFTIAHELGHAMHTYYSNNNQPYSTAGYEIFVAEVASTVNETLLIMHLLKDASNEYKKYLLNYLVSMFRTTVFRQAQFAEFELKAHELVEKGEPLTPSVLSDMYYELNKEYYGRHVVNDELIKYEWARIPHFYTAFYVYKYSTGLISAICIAKDILEKGEEFVEKYKAFLSAGGSMSPLDILKLVNVDLTTNAPYEKAMKFFKDTLEELEKLN